MSNERELGEVRRRLERIEEEVSALRARLHALEAETTREDSHVMDTAAPGAPGVEASSSEPPMPPPLPRTAPSEVPPPIPSSTVAGGGGRVFTTAGEPEPGRLRRFLAALHLVPPKEGSGEAQLGAWWATRIGTLFAVLGVVFFGVYLSLNTSPWVKLLELAAVSAGMVVAGLWFGRRVPKFGSVVLGGGLALVYFTAFAAYAVPAVKVTDSLAVAAVLQAGAVALVFAMALWRNTSTVASMATALGFVSALFSVVEGIDDFAVYGGIALVGVAVGLRRWKGWAAPLVVASVLVHVVYLAVASVIWDTELGARSAVFVFVILAGNAGLVLGSLFLEAPDPADGGFARAQRWIQSLNTPLAVLAGFVGALIVLPHDSMSRYFFAVGVVLAGAAAGVFARSPRDPLFGMFAVKATALIALGACLEWGERTRWMALAIEAFVVLAASQRTRSRALAVASAGAWVVSLGFFLDDVSGLFGRMASAAGGLVGAYVLMAPAFFTAMFAVWGRKARDSSKAMVQLLMGGAAAVPAWYACRLVFDERWGPLAMLLVGAVIASFGYWRRSRIPGLAALVAALGAHAAVYGYDVAVHGGAWLWGNVAVVALVTTTAGWRCSEVEGPQRAGWTESWRLLGAVLTAAGLAVVWSGMLQSVGEPFSLAVAGMVAAAVIWGGVVGDRVALTGAGVLALAAAAFMGEAYTEGIQGFGSGNPWRWGAAVGALAGLAGLVHPGRIRELLQEKNWFRLLNILAGAAGVAFVWAAVLENLDTAWAVWALLAFAGAFLGVSFFRRAGAGIGVAAVLALLMMFHLTFRVSWSHVALPWLALGGSMLVGLLFAAVPAMLGSFGVVLARRGVLSRWRLAHAVLAMVFLISLALEDRTPWVPIASVVWALGGIGVFFLGLFFRSRPHRLVGLVGLAACVGRVFLVDINSTLYRIAAFLVLGGVLLWVGFSYQKFRHLIEERPEEEPGEDNQPERRGNV